MWRVSFDSTREKCLAVAGSVTDETHVQDVVRRTLDSFGKIDVLVNNAGIGEFGKRLHETDDATWAKVLDVNLTGVFRMTRAVIPQMLKQGRGSIVNISSVAELSRLSGLTAYTASKGALDALTRAMAVEYAKEGIRCNVVNPGLINTPMAAPLMANPDSSSPFLPNMRFAVLGRRKKWRIWCCIWRQMKRPGSPGRPSRSMEG